MMRETLTKFVNETPFVPFTIELGSGRQLLVRSRDHIFLGPQKGGLIVVADDRGLYDFAPVLHITSLRREQAA